VIELIVASGVDLLDITAADVGLSHQVTAVPVPADAPWPRKLEAAQNVIFCKEVFAQVCRHVVFVCICVLVFLRYQIGTVLCNISLSVLILTGS